MRTTYTTQVAHPDDLTPTQRRVLALIAEGATNRQIAHALGIDLRTLTTHTGDIYDRMPTQTLGNQRVVAARWWWETAARSTEAA